MASDYQYEAFPILRDFLSYHENIKAHSAKTVNEYYLDLRMFFRYMLRLRSPELRDQPIDEIDIRNIDLNFVKSVSVSDILSYLTFLSKEREGSNKTKAFGEHGLSAKTKARKQASIRSFYNYMTKTIHLMEHNPALAIDSPKQKKTLPHFLEESECYRLLDAVSGPFEERDYCIILLFLSCGLRVSELVGLNISDIRDDMVRVRGKGNKERMLFLNDACQEAIDDYLLTRNDEQVDDKSNDALFISRNYCRISTRGVQKMIDKTLLRAGIDVDKYSPHKLRHTAATLMLQNGVDVRTLQDVLGHENLNTTQIYTHVDNEGLRVAAMANPIGRRRKNTKPNEQ